MNVWFISPQSAKIHLQIYASIFKNMKICVILPSKIERSLLREKFSDGALVLAIHQIEAVIYKGGSVIEMDRFCFALYLKSIANF